MFYIKRFLLSILLSTLVISNSVLAGGVTQRAIGDFVSRQGTFCLPDGNGGCLLFVPPVENFVAWGDAVKGIGASVDYAGLANKYLVETSGGHLNLGTLTSGTIIEQALSDGRADVNVTLRTSNALSWVVPTFDFTGPTVFGAKVGDVLRGATPALGTVEFRIRFTNIAPGAPLPDLIQLFFAPSPGMALIGYSFQASASGTLCDGTPSTMNVSQTGNAARSNIQAAIVNLHGAKPRCP